MRTLAAFAGLVACLALLDTPPGIADPSSPDATKVLWRDPGPIAARDLYWGAGSHDRAPTPPFTFVRENTSGTKPKVEVTDASGVSWMAKLATLDPAGNEVHAEIAASRFLWALGYFVEEHYFVAAGRIEGVKDLKRAANVIGPDGSFRAARFERRPAGLRRQGDWNIEDNPFTGTPELAGLHMLVMLLDLWDLRPANSAIVRAMLPSGAVEDRYLLSDVGSAFGRVRGGFRDDLTRWDLEAYSGAKFMNGVVQGKLQSRYPLLGRAPVEIPLAHARWFMGYLSQLSDRQVRAAFEAAGASPGEVEGFTSTLVRRLSELSAAIGKGN
jgi:hypothetical protein